MLSLSLLKSCQLFFFLYHIFSNHWHKIWKKCLRNSFFPLNPGGYSQKNWVGVCGLLPKTLTYLWPKWWQNSQNRYPIYDQNGWKPLPFGAAHTYIAHIREYPPRGQLPFIIINTYPCRESFLVYTRDYPPLRCMHPSNVEVLSREGRLDLQAWSIFPLLH